MAKKLEPKQRPLQKKTGKDITPQKKFSYEKEAEKTGNQTTPQKKFGKEYIDHWGKSDPIECRNLSEEVGTHNLLPTLDNAIEEGNKRFSVPFYILISAKKELLYGENVVHFTPILSDHPLPPKLNATLVKAHPKEGYYDFLWSIPDENGIESILNNPDTYDPYLVECCMRVSKEMKKKKLLKE